MEFPKKDQLTKLLSGKKFNTCIEVVDDSGFEECFEYYATPLEMVMNTFGDYEPKFKISILKKITEDQPEALWKLLEVMIGRRLGVDKDIERNLKTFTKHIGFSNIARPKFEFIEDPNQVIQEQRTPRKFVRDIIRDIVFKIKDDIRNQKTFKFRSIDPGFGNKFDLELILNKGVDEDGSFMKPYNIEGFWDDDTNTMEIFLNIDPESDNSLFYDLIGDLNDFISHELTHKKQYERGDKIPKRNIKRPETYYSQPHELEAQLAGFKRKSKLSKVPLEVVIRNYFDKRRDKYNLTDRIIDRLTKRIMEYGS
jgi:hypothetical protein